MAQPSSPSISMSKDHQSGPPHNNAHSNSHVPIDPSISQASPTYPPYSPYGPQPGQEMPPYPPHQAQHMYRPPHDWPSYPPQHGMPGQYQHPPVQGPPPAAAPNRPGQVRSQFICTIEFSSNLVTGLQFRSHSRCSTAQTSTS